MSETPQLRRRIMPYTSLTLNLEDANGDKFVRNFKLSWDFNAQALVEFRTKMSMLDGSIWTTNSPTVLSAMLQAAVLMHQPEYGGEVGLEVLRSYLDAGNIVEVSTALNEAFIASLPVEKQKKIRELQKAKAEDPTLPAPSQPTPEAV